MKATNLEHLIIMNIRILLLTAFVIYPFFVTAMELPLTKRRRVAVTEKPSPEIAPADTSQPLGIYLPNELVALVVANLIEQPSCETAKRVIGFSLICKNARNFCSVETTINEWQTKRNLPRLLAASYFKNKLGREIRNLEWTKLSQRYLDLPFAPANWAHYTLLPEDKSVVLALKRPYQPPAACGTLELLKLTGSHSLPDPTFNATPVQWQVFQAPTITGLYQGMCNKKPVFVLEYAVRPSLSPYSTQAYKQQIYFSHLGNLLLRISRIGNDRSAQIFS